MKTKKQMLCAMILILAPALALGFLFFSELREKRNARAFHFQKRVPGGI